MGDAMPGWGRTTLATGTDPVEATGVPPEGFVRLTPVRR